MDKTILVIGGTGKFLGVPVVRNLKEAGFHVRIMTRSKEKAQVQFGETFEIVGGDVLDTLSLKKAMEGCFGVHINLTEDVKLQGVNNVVLIALEKGIQRITYTEGIMAVEDNVDFPTIKLTLNAEKMIRDSGIPFTIFCPTFIMETLEWYIEGNRAGMLGTKLPLTHLIAGNDFGRMVAAGYKTEEAVNKKLFMYGPEPVPLLDALKEYCAVLHPEVKKVSTMPFWMANFMAFVMRNKDLKEASQTFALFNKVGECGSREEADRILGAPTVTFKEWLEQKASGV